MSRDTDRDWNEIAARHPYYGVLANERYRNPSEADLIDFYQTGENDIAGLLLVIRRVFGDFQPKSGLDFGCGVGRLLIPMARSCGSAVGIDIAEGMLSIARSRIEKTGVQARVERKVPIGEQFDWVNTLIVLQHILPARGYAIIRQLWDAVAPGGVLSMHLTIFKDGRHRGELTRDLLLFGYDGERAINYSVDLESSVSMSMFDYDLSRVFACMPMPDGSEVLMRKSDHGGCHGFTIFARKS